MKYLIYFNKFAIDKEKLKPKLGKIIEFSDKKALVDQEINKLFELEEIDKIIELKTDFKRLDFKELQKDSLKILKSKKFWIKANFESKIKISAKSIYKHVNPYLKHEGFIPDENYEELLFIDLDRINGNIMYRLGITNKRMFEKQNPIEVDMKNYTIVVEEPELKSELKDFLRVCWIFKIPLNILTKDKEKMNLLLSSAIKEVKGVTQELLEIKTISKLPKNCTLIGFTKHSMKNEKDLIKILKKDKKYTFIFGNDKYGLSQEIRSQLEYSIHLGPKSEKPFRGSQALSYVLGFIQ